MKWRYDPNHPERFPDDFEERCAALKERDYPVTISINGPFWQMREWVGMENLCMLMIDDPDFVHEMAETWTEFVSATLKQITDRVELDNVHLSRGYGLQGAQHDLAGDGAPVPDARLSCAGSARSRRAAARSMTWTRTATSRC